MDNNILEKLQQHQKLTYEECFAISLESSKLLNSEKKEDKTEARNLIIRVLDNWSNTTYLTVAIEFLQTLFLRLVSILTYSKQVYRLRTSAKKFAWHITDQII